MPSAPRAKCTGKPLRKQSFWVGASIGLMGGVSICMGSVAGQLAGYVSNESLCKRYGVGFTKLEYDEFMRPA